MLTGGRWECGWCLDSGWLSVKPAPVRIELRFVCRVDLDEAWKDLRAELDQLVPALLRGRCRLAVLPADFADGRVCRGDASAAGPLSSGEAEESEPSLDCATFSLSASSFFFYWFTGLSNASPGVASLNGSSFIRSAIAGPPFDLSDFLRLLLVSPFASTLLNMILKASPLSKISTFLSTLSVSSAAFTPKYFFKWCITIIVAS